MNTQSADGSFQSVGTPLLSKGLSGGMGNEKTVGLTAYVLISLLTALKSTPVQNYDHKKIDRSLLYLKKTVYDVEITSSYTLALSLYAFKLANEHKAIIKEIENELENRAVVDGMLAFVF